jgi:amino acid transporter
MDLQSGSKKTKSLSVFSLVMINVIAVDSLRSLTAGAEYGLALISFYLITAIVFFIPTILVTAELATGWPNTGGVYVWVREAFGPRCGFLTIWLQWIYNVVWFPTIFAFIAGVLAYLIHPDLVNNKIYMLTVILTCIWVVTFINCLGIKISSWFSALGAIVGTLFPMALIAILGCVWLYFGKNTHSVTLHDFLPNPGHLANLAFLTNILFGLMGIEMSAVHAGDVKNPQRDYPRALLISGIIIFITLVFACLAIAIVIPADKLNLVSGLLDAFTIFFNAYHMNWFMPVIAVLIILGSLSGAAAWIIGPARGLYIATQDNELPRFLQRVNQKNMPVGILLTQGVVVTLLCVVFLIMPSVNSSYWVLSNLTAQLGLLFYIFMFAAFIRLRFKHAHTKRAFKVPGGKIGACLVAGLGIITCASTLVLGFSPPAQLNLEKIISYEIILIVGMIVFCVPPFFLHVRRKKTS